VRGIVVVQQEPLFRRLLLVSQALPDLLGIGLAISEADDRGEFTANLSER
jgi:hypothetical protein